MPQPSSVLWTESSVLAAESPVVELASRKLKAQLSTLMENKGRGIYAEFGQLKTVPINASTNIATGQKAHSKNRHCWELGWDLDRLMGYCVVLKVLKHHPIRLQPGQTGNQ